MYRTTPPVSRPLNGMGNELIDGSGTINPAALNSTGMTRISLLLFFLLAAPSPLFAQMQVLKSQMHPSNCLDGALSPWLKLTNCV